MLMEIVELQDMCYLLIMQCNQNGTSGANVHMCNITDQVSSR